MKYWIQISSGRGPEECCWVTAQVTQQIIMDAEKANIRTSIIKAVPGTLKGTLKSALISIEDKNILDEFTSRWKGTIKWIGQSRFRPKCKRKNWFVGVEIFENPALNNLTTKEIKIEKMRSSGPGGQHANKTESAVRVTHLPTGLSAVAQEERSQYCNKKLAMARLENLIKRKNNDVQKQKEQQCWNQHNILERGNAVRVFKGPGFKEK